MAYETIRVAPAKGKFLSLTISSGSYQIHSFSPSDGSYGTDVPYEAGIHLLTKIQPPPVVIVPVVDKSGKVIQQIKESDQKMIDVSREQYFRQVSVFRPTAEYVKGVEASTGLSSEDRELLAQAQKALEESKALKKSVSEKDSQLAEQAKDIQKLKDAVNKLIDAQNKSK